MTEFALWAMLVGTSLAMIFPDLVRAEMIVGESLVDRGTVRLFAAPLFLLSVVLLTDLHFHWSKGLI